MATPYKNTQEIINKCNKFSNTNILNSGYYQKLLENKDFYNGEDIDCIELQALYMSILKKPIIGDNFDFKKSRR